MKWKKYYLFVPENLREGSTITEASPSGKYNLTIDFYKTSKRTWDFTKGTVRRADGTIVSVVFRNYSSFWRCWAEDHPDGHDYLLCGEDYQGQTIIQLDTGERKDTMSEGAEKGFGFCWALAKVSTDKTLLAVVGCFWGGPYDCIIYDFSNPMGELKEVKRIYNVDDCDWVDNNTISAKQRKDCRKFDGKIITEGEEEWEKAYEAGDIDECTVDEIIKIRE